MQWNTGTDTDSSINFHTDNKDNKPKVWSVQLGKTLNFSIKFLVPPPQEIGLNIVMEGGGGRNSLALVKPSYKILASC